MKARVVWLALLALVLVPNGAFDGTPHSVSSAHIAAPLPDAPLPGEIMVLRVRYASRAELDALTSIVEPWEVHPDPDGSGGTVIVGVDADGMRRLQSLGLGISVDAALTAAASRSEPPAAAPAGGIPGFACYRTVDETLAAAEALAQAYPGLASWIDIGDSWEKVNPGGAPGSDLRVLVLTNPAVPGPKPRLFVMSGLHAREYAPVELLARFAELLLGQYGSDADITWLLDYQEVHLLLEANPDGRRYAEAGYLWRKNTNQAYCSPTSFNRGADLNRNFDFDWGCCGGSSSYPCYEVYRGPAAASEPETQAIQNYLLAHFPDRRGPNPTDAAPPDTMGLFIDVHSYGRLVLWPWGSTGNPPPNAAGLQTLGHKLAYFNGYTPQQANMLYITDGTSDNYAYGALGLAAYTIEVGDYFFQDCSTFEADIYPNNLSSLVYAARVARAPYLLPAGPDALQVQAAWPEPGPSSSTRLTVTFDDSRYSSQGLSVPPVQPVSAAEYTLDTPPWSADENTLRGALEPLDGAWDSPVEAAGAVIDLSALDYGRHSIYVRAQDAAGNWGPVSAVFIHLAEHARFLPLLFR